MNYKIKQLNIKKYISDLIFIIFYKKTMEGSKLLIFNIIYDF